MCEFSNAVKNNPAELCASNELHPSAWRQKRRLAISFYSATSSVHPLVYITVLNIRYSHPNMCTAQEIVDPRSASSPK